MVQISRNSESNRKTRSQNQKPQTETRNLFFLGTLSQLNSRNHQNIFEAADSLYLSQRIGVAVKERSIETCQFNWAIPPRISPRKQLKAPSNSTSGLVIIGLSCFHIQKTSHLYAQPNW